MKFRCERDTLVEALSTAGRAVATRGGALPVLSGVRLEVAGDQLRLAGSDLDLTIQVEASVNGLGDGVSVLDRRGGSRHHGRPLDRAHQERANPWPEGDVLS